MNIKNDNIQDYDTSFSKLVSGINKVCDIIKPTYGAAGGNVVIEETMRPGHRVANDGKLITDSIWLSDPVEQIGVNLLREVCEKQEREAGDGRKTTCILTAAILNEGLKYKDKIKPLELKRQLDECLPVILKSIDEQKKEIEPKDIHSVATIASESPEIGKIIGEAYEKIGRDGIIEIEPSSLPETFYEVVEGIRVRAGWFGGYWQTEEGKLVVKDPKILISKDKITDIKQIMPVVKEMRAQGKTELVIYCEEMELVVASSLAKNTLLTLSGELPSDKIPLKVLIIKAPTLWKDWFYEDLSKVTGAKMVNSKLGQTFSMLKYEDLGSCETLVCTKEETRIIGIKDIQGHIETLKEAGLKDDQQLLRASWLNTKVAILKVGANSESELSWKIKKAKDACHASYYALKDGVVMGAGCSIDLAGAELIVSDSGIFLNGIGKSILINSLKYPLNQLLENRGTGIKHLDKGIIDPAIVVKSAITNAISIAGIILTTTGAITIPPEVKEEIKAMSQRMTPR